VQSICVGYTCGLYTGSGKKVSLLNLGRRKGEILLKGILIV